MLEVVQELSVATPLKCIILSQSTLTLYHKVEIIPEYLSLDVDLSEKTVF